MVVVLILAFVSIFGLLLTCTSVFLVWRAVKRHSFRRLLTNNDHEGSQSDFRGCSPLPRVSILKPLCGLEDGLEENLASFANLRGPSYEVIFSIADRSDPAVAVVERVRQRFPDAPFLVVIGGIARGLVANPKVERLIAASRLARGEIFLISDANVRVSADHLVETISLFDNSGVGLVSNLFVGAGPSSFGSIVESLYLLTVVLPGTIIAEAFGFVCVVGKSMAIRRDVCDAIRGLEAFSDVLAEDQAMGLAVREAGYRVVVSPVIVRNVTQRRTLGSALARQIRWGKIRYSFSKRAYFIEFLGHPFPLSLIAFAIALALGDRQVLLLLIGLSCGSMLVRLAQAVALSKLTSAGLSLRHLSLTPVQDVLQFAAQFVPYFSNEVNWRGHRARLGRRTLMLPSRKPAVAHSSLEEKSAWSLNS